MENCQPASKTSSFDYPKQLAFAISMAFTSTAYAAPIQFEQHFETRSNELGSLWSEIENDPNDVAVYNGALRLRDNAAGPVSAAAISNIDYDNTMNYLISFTWRATQSTESSDFLHFGLYNQDVWQPLWTASLGGSSWQREDITLGAGLEIEGQFAFWSNLSERSETAYIDYLYLQSEPPVSQNSVTTQVNLVSVDEPASIVLSLFGLAAAYRRSVSFK